MKVLQIHNTYKHLGGEDVIVELEQNLLTSRGVEVRSIKFDNRAIQAHRLFFNPKSYETVDKEIKLFLPDIIHVHNLFYEATPSVLKCAKDNGVPVVMTLHNFRLVCPNGLLLRNDKPCLKCLTKTFAINSIMHSCFQESKARTMLLASTLAYHNMNNTWHKYVNKFITLTSFAKEKFMESSLGLSEKQISIKPNSIDDLLEENKMEKEVYTFIGRLSNEKGIQVAIKAFNKLPNLTLEIVGTGPLQDKMVKIANKNIKFHGSKPREFIKQQLKRTKALIFPSVCYEGLPNTILEAYSAGVPVIASNIDNINCIVKDQVCGMLFEVNNPKSLIETINIFDKNYKALSLTENVRKVYTENYTHDKNIKSLLSIYNEAISNN